ncbi:MAG: DDE_Tnp_1-associated, partial [Candidatus Kentron sp. G]
MNTDLVSILSTVKDPRTDRNKLYPLPEILLLCISAVLSGADGWKSIVLRPSKFEGHCPMIRHGCRMALM